MGATYVAAEIADVPLFQVRFLIRDTNTDRPLFDDDEITWQISQEANIYTAAAGLCDILVTKAGGVKSKKVGELAITYDVGFYRSLSANLRARGAGHQVPYAGGISVSDKQGQEADTDATKPSVFRRLNDNPATRSIARPGSNNDSDPLTTI